MSQNLIKYIIGGLLFCLGLNLFGQIEISGRVQLDSSWNSMIYISEIQGMDDLYRCSPQMIIAEAPIVNDSFSLVIEKDMAEPGLIRLHVSKLNAPSASLVVGGADENYGIYAIDNSKSLTINSSDEQLFKSFSVHDSLNSALSSLQIEIDDFEYRYELAELPSTKMDIYHSFENRMKEVAVTTDNVLIAAFAIDQINGKIFLPENSSVRKILFKKFGHNNYLSFNYKSSGKNTLLIVLGAIIIFVLLSGLGIYYLREVRPGQKLKMLTSQERRVVELIIDGHSNKSIANELNVEVSTVKSHVYKIFNKMKVKSRNELVGFQKFVKDYKGD